MEKNLYSKTSFASLLLIVGLVVFLYLACRDDIMVEPGGAFLAGMVVDSLSSAPIESAWVSLVDSLYDPSHDVVTDSTGYYVVFTGTPGIHRWAFCGKEGYVIQMKSFSTAPDETTIVNFRLM
ncbi:MAG: carboxypeptidase-like regulatory domain-containing protein [Candidatus Zixiibacteriota bacterium]